MKKITKLLFTLLSLGVACIANAATEKVHATFENPSNTNTTWNSETKTFTWSTTYYNQLKNIGLPTGDITKYKKLVVDCEIKSGEKFRILFYKGGSNLTLWAEDGVNEFIIKDELEKLDKDHYNEYLLACDEICLSGSNAVAPGEAVINDVYLETYNDEGEMVYATFESPSNTNTTWNSETKTFTWSTTYYNQLKNIGLPTGDISGYKKLVVDCEIKSGEKFRILFYKGGSNLTLWAEDGVNEFIIKDELEKLDKDHYNEYLLACDEICLSGSNAAAPGEVVINSVYLETYPENESVEIPEIVYEEDPGKPAGTFVDFTDVFTGLNPRIGIGEDTHPIVLGNGEVVVGARGNKNVIADLSAYSKLTIVTSPNLKLVIYMNHEIDSKQNAGDYTEDEAGKYEFLQVQADENGLIEVDLTKYDKQELNCIAFPWDNNNKGTVWYLLLTESNGVKAVIGEAGYATFSSDKAVEFEGVEAYIGKVNGSSLTLTPVTWAPANTAVILKGAAGTYNFPLFEAELSVVNDLKISDGNVSGDKIYVLAKPEGKEVGFYLLDSSKKVPAGKAYIELPATAPALEFIGFNMETTGINDVRSKMADVRGDFFDLQGRKVANPTKGLYIVNGKKVAIK